MIGFALRWWRPLAVLALAIGLWWHGYSTGAGRCETAHELALARADARAAQALSDLAAAEQRNRLLALELEDDARAEPVQSPACLPRSRVLRLNSR